MHKQDISMPRASSKYLLLQCFFAAWMTFGVSACSKENQNTEEGQVPTPGAAYRAVIFHRKADAVRTETENISIVQYGQMPLNDIGNVYSASRETTGAAQKLWINWRTPDTLQIFRDPSTHSYKEEKHFDCMTGVFIQTTPFHVEYGDIRDVQAPGKAEAKTSKTPIPSKSSKKQRQK